MNLLPIINPEKQDLRIFFVLTHQKDDLDQGPGQTGIWEGTSAVDQTKVKREPIAGNYTLYLCAYDPKDLFLTR
jgi:hypothetical protein